MNKKVIPHRLWLTWAYTLEGYIFYRFVNPDQNDSEVELYQVVPSQKIKDLIKTF